VTDLLIANQIVGEEKLQRLARLARRVQIAVAVDDAVQIAALSNAARAGGVEIGVLVEADVGNGRCGLRDPEALAQLARQIAGSPGLRLEGIQAYEGHATYIDDLEKRRALVAEAVDRVNAARAAFPAKKVSGGSTSTASFLLQFPGIDEIQAGTYATMDWRYNQLTPHFDIALSVLTRVLSRPREGVAVLDVGSKGLGSEYGPPRVKGAPELATKVNEEHTIVTGEAAWKVGDLVEIVPSHACTTCNLHREFVVHEGGRIVDRWAIEASGKMR
jgi:D-serine deaminase-like pyridoxal phosphate-dependent protein